MKIHIVPASDFTALLLGIITGLTERGIHSAAMPEHSPSTPVPPVPTPQPFIFPRNCKIEEGSIFTRNKIEPTTPIPPSPAPQRPTFPENRMVQEGSISAARNATAIRDIPKAQFVSSHDITINRGTADQILAQVRRNKATKPSLLSSVSPSSVSSPYYTSAKALDLIGQIVADKRITPAQAIAAITGITDQTLKKTEDSKTQDSR